MLNVLNYTDGYLKIKIEGLFPERFVNVCIQKNISLWQLNRNKNIITANISRKNFKNIRKIAKNTRNNVKIIKKDGLIFTFKNIKKDIFL